ncbi:MAG: hypothetical protein V3U54_13245 [Thermodesulfobacteriota bacterium]
MNLDNIEKDFNRYMDLLNQENLLRQQLRKKSQDLESYDKKGEISEVWYNSQKYQTPDGRSYYWVSSYGTAEEKQYFRDIIEQIKYRDLTPIRQQLDPIEKEMKGITDKYYPIYRNHYVGFPDSSEHEAFLETIVNTVKIFRGENPDEIL